MSPSIERRRKNISEIADLRARLSAAEQELSAFKTMLQVSLEEGVRLVRAAGARVEAAEHALHDLAEATDAVCQLDALATGDPVLPSHARSVLELSLQRARAALAGREEAANGAQ